MADEPKPEPAIQEEPAAGTVAAQADAFPPPVPDTGNKLLQGLVTTVVVLVLGLLTLIPLTFAGLVQLAPDVETHEARQVQILIACAFLLYAALGMYMGAGYGKRTYAAVGARMMYKTKRDLVLNSLSVGTTILLVLLTVVEVLAALVFVGVLEATSSASIAFASNYLLFATFTLIFLDLVILARTTYRPRDAVRPRAKAMAYAIIPLSVLVMLVGLLVSLQVLSTGAFSQIEPRQSVYIVTLGVLFQLLAFKLLLRYPALISIAVRAVVQARKAGKEMREEIQKRAIRSYLLGLGFVMLSMILFGGIATQRINIQEQRTTNFLLVFYIVSGAIVMGILVTRYLQHRYVEARARRKERGELIAQRRRSPDDVRRVLILSFSGFFGTTFLLAGLLTLAGRTPVAATYGTDLLIMAFLTGIGPFGFYHAYRIRRQRAMDEKFPDFLRDLAESERAGMTLPRALLTAARGTYGALTNEIRTMSAQVEWGVSFTEALERFADRVGTPLIKRAVVLIVEAANAGGNVVDILTAASDDAREIKQILEERSRQMSIYSIIIYIAFFVFLVVIFVLAAQFLPGFEAATGAASGQQVGGLNLSGFDKDAFITIFFHGSLIQAIGGGLVAGVMTGGSPIDGLKHSFIMTIIAWIFFRVLL